MPWNLLADELGWLYVVVFQHVGELLRRDGDGAAHELGNVVALHEFMMIVRVALGQFEGLRAVTVLVDMGDERTGEVAIDATTAKDDPTAVARPGVIAFRVLGVDFVHGAGIRGKG